MKKISLPVLCGIALFAMQCAPPAGPAVDVEAEKAAVLKADSAWSVAAKDADTHLASFADDAVVLASNEPIVSGKKAIGEMLTQMHAMPGFGVTWQANSAVVSASGDMAYTLGNYKFTANDTSGTPMTDQGKYVTVWTKQNGEWKVAVDAFNSDMAH